MNHMGKVELDRLAQIFETSMKNNYSIFDRHAFRKRQQNSDRRSVINIALFDVFSVEMTKYSEQLIKEQTDQFRQISFQVMQEQNFTESITLSTNSLRNVAYRFKSVETAFQEAFHVNPNLS